MGIIFYDHSEGKKGTRLPQNVIDCGRKLNGLEAFSGADILVSPLSLPVKDLVSEPSINMFRRHIQAGCLIQRKTGRDAVNSIPHYTSILKRMLEHSAHPLLVTIGQYSSNKHGKVVVDGFDTEWSYNSFIGALDAWQYCGGYYMNLSRDGQLLGYLNLWLERLSSDDWIQGKEKHPIGKRIPRRVIGEPDWVSVVLSLGIGFGGEKVNWLQENFNGLGDFLCFFSEESNLKSPLIEGTKGIGKSHFKKVRTILNLNERCDMGIYDRGGE